MKGLRAGLVPHVNVEVGLAVEALPADLAVVEHVAGVLAPHVVLQRGFHLEAGGALGAQERLLARVLAQVHRQAGRA